MSDMNTTQQRRGRCSTPTVARYRRRGLVSNSRGIPPDRHGRTPGYRPPSEGSKAAPDPKAEAAHKEAMAASSGSARRLPFSTSTATAASVRAAAPAARSRRTRWCKTRISWRSGSIRSIAADHRHSPEVLKARRAAEEAKAAQAQEMPAQSPWPRACRALPLASPPKWRVAKEVRRLRTSTCPFVAQAGRS